MECIAFLAGLALILMAGADVCFTVIATRNRAGLLSHGMDRAVWYFFRQGARLFRTRKDTILSWCGPTLMVLTIGAWVLFFIAGFALMAWPGLGSGITSVQGPTSTHFSSALYYSGHTFTTLGVTDLVPRTAFYRTLMVVQSAVGFSLFTLVIIYFLSVYHALRRRNAFALILHHKTLQTADAAEYIALLCTDGNTGDAYCQLSAIASELADLQESHRLYPILHYFRMKEAPYSLARIAAIVMDAVSLIRTALPEHSYGGLIHSSSTHELWHSGMSLMPRLSRTLLPERHHLFHPDEGQAEEWRKRYFSALHTFARRGIPLTENPQSGADSYIGLRRHWDPYVTGFCRCLLLEEENMLPVRARDEAEEART